MADNPGMVLPTVTFVMGTFGLLTYGLSRGILWLAEQLDRFFDRRPRSAEKGDEAIPAKLAEDWSAEFAKHTNWELTFDGDMRCDDGRPNQWTVWAVNGGLNDREWRVIGRGHSPLAAIRDALRAAERGEG